MQLRRQTLILAVVAAILAPDAGASAKVPPKLRGKVFFTTERLKDVAPDALTRLFASAKPGIELSRGKAEQWKVNLVAFFPKASALGPMTIWMYDKSDKAALKAKEPVHVASVNNSSSREVFVHDLELDPNMGFNRNYSYLVFVGQIIGKKVKHYAQGEVSLK